MGGKETGERDKEYIIAFQKLIAQWKAIPNKELRLQNLEGLLNTYEVLMPLLPVSDPTKRHIHNILIKAISG